MFFITKSIKEEDKERFKRAVSCLKSDEARKRAFVNSLAVSVLVDYFNDNQISADIENFNKSILFLDKYDIATLKVENCLIEARAIVGEDYPQMWVPKAHRNLGLLPDIYVGIRIGKSLDKADIIGFIETRKLRNWSENNNYFVINSSHLRTISGINRAILSINSSQKSYKQVDHENAKKLFLSFINGKISKNNSNFLINHLLYCEICRNEFYNFYNLNKKLSFIKNSSLIEKFKLNPVEQDKKADLNLTPIMAPANIIPLLAPPTEPLNLPTIVGSTQLEKFTSDIQLPEEENIIHTKTDDTIQEIKAEESLFFNEQEENNNITRDESTVDHINQQIEIEDIIKEIKVEESLLFNEQEENNNITRDESTVNPINQQIEENSSGINNNPTSNENLEANIQEDCIRGENLECIIPQSKNTTNSELKSLENNSSDNLPLNEDIELSLDEDCIRGINLECIIPEDNIKSSAPQINLEEPLSSISSENVDLNVDIESLKESDEPEIKVIIENLITEITDHLENVEVVESFEAYTKLLDLDDISIENIEDLNDEEHENTKKSDIAENNDEKSQVSFQQNNNSEILNFIENNTENYAEELAENIETKLSTEEIELSETNTLKKKMMLKLVIVSAIVGILLIIVGSAFFQKNKTNSPELKKTMPKSAVQKPTSPSTVIKPKKVKSAQGKKVLPTNPPPAKADMKKINNNTPKTSNNALFSSGEAIRVRNISWEVGVSLANNKIFRKYLLITGQALKMSLSKNLLSATERIENTQIKMQIALDLNGNIKKTKIKTSSGSKQIDDIITHSIKETFSLTKMPKVNTSKNYVITTLIINL